MKTTSREFSAVHYDQELDAVVMLFPDCCSEALAGCIAVITGGIALSNAQTQNIFGFLVKMRLCYRHMITKTNKERKIDRYKCN